MEIGSDPNSPNGNNKSPPKQTLSDDVTFDHPPSKKFLTDNSMENSQAEKNDDDVTMDLNREENANINKSGLEMKMDDSTASQGQSAAVDWNEDGEDNESRAEATFQLVIENFSKFKDSRESRLNTTPCVVRNLPWKILAMSKQGSNRESVLGFFLQCNADSESARWSVCAVAELRLLHLTEPEKNFVKKIQHLFYLKENDWGFSPFITMKEIMDPERGFYSADKDSITLEVWLNADAPHGTSWDSKKLTGFVGLTNQGATCYMNSLLQTLYFTSELRKAVYCMPTENDDPFKSVPYALQRVFYDLQFSEKSVGTKKLTRSFGWETLDTFMQHDVQELCRVLLDNLENKMKNTKVTEMIPKLYKGEMISYVKCKSIDYESRRTEGFYDIQLNIKGKKDIYESFKDYVSVETLEGENKYDAGKFGLQEAQKGVVFKSFPPILHLHLMRFQYDPQTDSNIKINDRYEFFEQIELDEFLECGESTPAKYSLHAVLVHSGDNHGGHYVVFINPKLDGKWFKFDDEVVSRCTKRDAVNNNFGGSNSDDLIFRHSTNAYMLVYVRDSEKHRVLAEVQRADIPQGLQDRLADEKKLELQKKKERNEAHLYMQLNVILEKEFYENLGNSDLFDSSKIEATKSLKIKKTSTLAELMRQLAEMLNLNVEDIRLWQIMGRYNNTVRPLCCIELKENANKLLIDLAKQESTLTVFAETSSDLSFSTTFDFASLVQAPPAAQLLLQPQHAPNLTLPAYNSQQDKLLFFKFYDPKSSSLRYVFRMILPESITLNALQDKINKKMKFPPNTELLFFEEVKINQITPLERKDISLEQLAHEQLLHGDIYVFQIDEKEKLKTYKMPYVNDYFRDLSLQVEIQFCDKNNPNEDGFTLMLSLKMKYDEFAKLVGQHLQHDHEKLQFFRASNYDLKGAISQPIKYSAEFQLKDAFNMGAKPVGRRIFYQKLNIKVTELEERRQFKCLWISANLKNEKELALMPLKKASVRDLLIESRNELFKEDLITKQNFDDEAFKLRLVEIVASKIHRVLKEEILIETLDSQTSNKIYRVEQMLPEEAVCAGSDETIIPVAHFTKEIYATFGSPFLLKIRPGELFKDIKQRIQRKLDVNDKDFANYRFALISMGTPNYIPDDESTVFDISSSNGLAPWLGIDHINKAANKSKNRYSTMEKAIKIFN